jgi:predicted glutamine amidotransferase
MDPLGIATVDAVALSDVLRESLAALFALSARHGLERPIVNFLLTNGRVFVANRAGRELYLASQKRRCRDASTCAAEKICLAPTRADDRVNHLLVASEPIGDEDVWEPIPDNTMVALTEGFRLHVSAGAPAP